MSEFKTDIGQVYRDRLLAEAEMVRNYGLALEKIQDQQQTMDRMQARIEALEKALAEAATDIEDWGAYAGEYFQQKHDLQDCVSGYRALLEGGE